MRKSNIIGSLGGTLVATGGALFWFALERSGRITPEQADKLLWVAVGIVVIGVGILLLYYKYRQAENKEFVKSIPALISDMDIRRGEVIEKELKNRANKGDTQFVFNILKRFYILLTGEYMPELPKKANNIDVIEIISIVLSFLPKAQDIIKEVKRRTGDLGDKETGLLLARAVNTELKIDETLLKIYKKPNRILKTARTLLPSSVAVETTKAIDDYLDYSKGYRAADMMVTPLISMLENNALLKDFPQIIQVIDIFKQYKDKYLKEMNLNLARVSETIKCIR